MSDKPSTGKPPKAADPPRDTAVKKTPTKKAPAKKVPAKKAPAKESPAKKAPAKKAPAKKASAGKAPAKKTAAAQARDSSASRAAEKKPSGSAPAPASHAVPAQSQPAESTQADSPVVPSADLIRVPMAVRWRDLDAFNHVNNSKYLSYLEEARLHWMLSVPGQGMDDHVAPVVAAAQLNYRRPITWPAEVVVELFVERLGNTSLSIGHRIVDDEDGSIVYCDGNVVMVWIDRDSGRAADLPRAVREACSDDA